MRKVKRKNVQSLSLRNIGYLRTPTMLVADFSLWLSKHAVY